MRRLYHKYCKENGQLDQEVAEATAFEEYERQKQYLATAVDSLQKRVDFEASLHRRENVKITQENVVLVK